jgi:4'-phosphopantetheinyl transferase EntD
MGDWEINSERDPLPETLLEAPDHWVQTGFRALAPSGGCAVSGGPITQGPDDPAPAERVTLSAARAARRAEFAAGRAHAHRAMTQLGYPPHPIPALPSRAPQWPAGLVGSISHTNNLCAAVVANEALYQGIGIDIERIQTLPQRLTEQIATRAERAGWELQPAPMRALLPILTFSTKESVFKAVNPITNGARHPHGIVLNLDIDRCEFAVTLHASGNQACGGAKIEGRWRIERGYVLSLTTLVMRDVISLP